MQVNPLCQNHFTCNVSCSTLYLNLSQEHKGSTINLFELKYLLIEKIYKSQRIQVGNGQCVSVLFIIPVVVDIIGQRFQIYTLVSEIHEDVDLVLGKKNVFELEGIINSRDCCYKFLNRSLPIYPEKEIVLKPSEQKLVKVKAPFADELSGMAIIKILDGSTHSTLLIKLKFMHNKAVLDIVKKEGYYDILSQRR